MKIDEGEMFAYSMTASSITCERALANRYTTTTTHIKILFSATVKTNKPHSCLSLQLQRNTAIFPPTKVNIFTRLQLPRNRIEPPTTTTEIDPQSAPISI